MNVLDLILIIPIAYAAYKGFSKGFVYEIFSLLALGLGIYGCLEFSEFASDYLAKYVDQDKDWFPIATYTLTFIAIVVGVTMLGKLLDKMIASIGLDRTQALISNTVFWRPPGNRTPTAHEIAVCMPFVERLIELVDPKILVALGGPAAKSLLAQTAGVGKLRGKWFPYSTPGLARPIEATALYHPAYLLRSPGQKRATWSDWLGIKRKLEED